jgi:hypothetical protein
VRKIIAAFVVVIAFSLIATAQEYNKAEAFGGFQYTSFDTFNIQRSNLMGWDAQVTDYLRKPFGVTADVSGSYGSPDVGGFSTTLHNYSFLFGPTFRAPLQKATPFVHALFGFSHISHVGGSYSSSGFAYELGGGFDVAVAKSISYRVVQADYFRTKFDDPTNSGNGTQNHLRIATGIVFKF